MESGVPFWQVLLVTTISGVAGGVLVAVVQSWNEHRQKLRELRTDAANELVTAILKGMAPVSAILRAGSPNWNSLGGLRDELNTAYDASIAYTARVDLLFGIKSSTGQASGALTNAFAAVKHEIECSPTDLTKTTKLRDDVGDRLDDFTQAAHVMVVSSWWSRRRESVKSVSATDGGKP